LTSQAQTNSAKWFTVLGYNIMSFAQVINPSGLAACCSLLLESQTSRLLDRMMQKTATNTRTQKQRILDLTILLA